MRSIPKTGTGKKMGVPLGWLKIVRRKFLGSSNRDSAAICSNENDKPFLGNETLAFKDHSLQVCTKEDIAAIKIQAYFRSHLARRAYRALKSVVKLQALARGVFVRRQSRIALHCMHALVRLQVRIRARQRLGSHGD